MEPLKNTFGQFQKLYESFTPSQRGTLAVVTLLLPLAFYFLVIRGTGGGTTPVLYGRQFNNEEMNDAQTALFNAGLNDFETRGGQLLVPAGSVEKYNSAILSSTGLKAGGGAVIGEQEKMLNNLSTFASNKEITARTKIALENDVSKLLRQNPRIDAATVNWAQQKQRSWRQQGPSSTASVSLKPKAGHYLTPGEVNGIRLLVANSLPGLNPKNVSITDLSSLQTYTLADEDDPLSNRLLRLTQQNEEGTRNNLLSALSYIPGVNVAVKIDISKIKRQTIREQSVDSKASVAVRSSISSRQQQFQKRLPQAEPGVVPNEGGQTVDSSDGPGSSSTITEENNDSVTVPTFTIRDDEFFGAMPEATRVVVSIPEDYSRKLLARRQPDLDETNAAEYQAALDTVKVEVETDVQKKVATIVNLPDPAPPNAVTVTTVTPIDMEVPDIQIPMTDKLLDWSTEWGGAVMMVLLALWALRSLNKSMPKLPDMEVETAKLAASLQPEEKEEEEGPLEPSFSMPATSDLDEFQMVVKENPEMTAAVISNWIRNAI